MLVAFTATLMADQALYYVGRKYGPSLLARKPQWKDRVDRVFELLHRHNIKFILSFRFIYGIRIISPIVIGASGVDAKRFTLLNILAAVIWTIISCFAGYAIGYFFADALEDLIEKIIKYQKIFIIALVILITIYVSAKKFYTAHKDKKNNLINKG